MKFKSDYRINREALAGVVKERRLEAATDSIVNSWIGCPLKEQKRLFQKLTLGQKAIPLLQCFEGEVYNGGFHQFFWNSSGNNSAMTLEVLLALQTNPYAGLLQDALAVLAVKGKLENRRQRQGALRLLSKSAFDGFDDAFYKLNDTDSTSLKRLCLEYFEAHPEDFFLPAGVQPPTKAGFSKDYRLSLKKAEKITEENIHWLPIEKIWDDYWEALRGEKNTAEKFVDSLTPGQRALIAVHILRNQFSMGGFWEVFSFSLCPDLFIKEIVVGYALLKAQPYCDLFNEAIKVGAEIIAQTSQMAAISIERSQLKLRGENDAVKKLGREYMNLHTSRIELGKQMASRIVHLTDRFNELMAAPDTKIEKFIGDYLTGHRADFFKQ